MKTSVKFLLFLVLVAAVALVTSWALSFFVPLDFQKILHRSAAIFGFIGLFVFRKYIQKKPIVSLGIARHKGWIKNVLLGFLISFAAIGAVVGVSVLFGARIYAPDFTASKLLSYIFLNILAVALIGFFEELFFRGFLLQVLREDLKLAYAVIITNLAYAVVHFLKPMSNPALVASQIVGLFLLGLLFTYALLRTKSLFFSMGMHAGLVYFVKLQKLFFRIDPDASEFIWGDKIMIGGILSWIILVFAFFMVKLFTKTGNT